jgi:hypothetical protein
MTTEQFLLVADAAKYLTHEGRRTSPSLLRKLRLKGPEDPGPKGPPWARASNGYCLYPKSGLDAWVAEYKASLRPMAPSQMPSRLNRHA